MKQYQKWSLALLIAVLAGLLLMAAATAVIDPFFHYHAPLEGLQYPLNSQRYQNDGIVKHFSYDGLITGTSMTENFNVEQFEDLFHVHAVKASFSGGHFAEIMANLERAVKANPELTTVLCNIDEWFLLDNRELIQATGAFPTYLYDENPFNDVNYLFNREVFFGNTLEVLRYTHQGNTTTSFTDYGSWDRAYTYDAASLIAGYTRPPQAESKRAYTPELKERLAGNMGRLAALARENPQIEFYCYFPPYSVLNWDGHMREGDFERQLEEFRDACPILLAEENIHLFSFYTDYETTTNLNLYRDIVHHNGAVNALLMDRIYRGEYQLTMDNYLDHWQQVEQFYGNFDYDSLLAGQD